MDDRVRAFVEGITKEERLLVAIRDELYDGSWDELTADLDARMNRKPVVFKLNARLEEDRARVEKLRAFEAEHSVDLRDLLREVSLGTEGKNEEVGRGT